MSGLLKEPMHVSFTSGVDTKSDPKQVAANLLILENATFISPGRLRKRNGYATVNTGLFKGRALAKKNSGELIAWDGSRLSSYSASTLGFQSKGSMVSPTITKTPLDLTSYSIAGYDSATLSGIQVTAYEKWNGVFINGNLIGCEFSVTDTATGNNLGVVSLGATASCPKVLVFAGGFSVIYIDTVLPSLKIVRVTLANPTNPSPTVTTITTPGTPALTLSQSTNGSPFDACTDKLGTNMFISFVNNTAAGYTTFLINNATPTAVSGNASFTSVGVPVCVGAFVDNTAGVLGPVVIYGDAAGNTRYYAYSAALAVLATNLAIDTGPLATVVTGVSYGSLGNIRFFYTIEPSNRTALDTDIVKTGLTASVTGYLAITPTVYMRGVSVVSKPVVTQNSMAATIVLVPLAFDTSSRTSPTFGARNVFQSTYFLADDSGNISARIFPGTAGGAYQNNQSIGFSSRMLPETLVSGNVVSFPALSAYRIVTAATTTLFQTALVGISLNFLDSVNEAQRGELGQALMFSGGRLTYYDGDTCAEMGFHYYPFGLSSVAAAGGSLSPGQYQYAACFEWTDAYGQVVRSAPSAALTVTNAASDKNTVTIPTLRLTNKPGVAQVTLYRTQANGTTFYQINNLGSSTSSTLNNNPTVDSVSFVDILADTSIASNPQLYTTGGVLQNDAPPPCTALAIHRNRVFLLDSTNRLSVWYSKQVVPSAPVEFSAFLTLNIDPRGGDVTALATLDDKLIVFKSDRIFAVTGQGPDSTGAQNDFSDATLVTSDAGCAIPKSIVTMPQGIMFQSAKGWYLLTRSLQCEYVGAPVEAYNTETTVAALLVGTTNQVRFVTTNGHALVYDYLMRQWSIFTNISAGDAVIYQGGMNYLDPVGNLSQETIGSFADPFGTYISMRVLTAWIQTAGLQGFQRAYEMLILGDWRSSHSLNVSVAYDFGTAFTQTDAIPVTASTVPYQWRIFFAQQKCAAIQIQLQDVQNGSVGEGVALSGLTFLIGRKRGLRKIPSSSTFG